MNELKWISVACISCLMSVRRGGSWFFWKFYCFNFNVFRSCSAQGDHQLGNCAEVKQPEYVEITEMQSIVIQRDGTDSVQRFSQGTVCLLCTVC